MQVNKKYKNKIKEISSKIKKKRVPEDKTMRVKACARLGDH
jgi:hypothetical protein